MHEPIDDTLYRGCSVCGQWTTALDFCEAHDPFAPPTLAYTRIDRATGQVKSIAPPRRAETPWCRLRRLGEQARDLNSVRVRPLNALLTHWLVETQRRTATGQRARPPYLVILEAPGGVRCDCQAKETCGHVGAILLDLERRQAEAERTGDDQAAWNAEAMLTVVQTRFPDIARVAIVPTAEEAARARETERRLLAPPVGKAPVGYAHTGKYAGLWNE